MKTFEVVFTIEQVSADTKQDAVEEVLRWIREGGNTWIWEVKEENNPSDNYEEIEA